MQNRKGGKENPLDLNFFNPDEEEKKYLCWLRQDGTEMYDSRHSRVEILNPKEKYYFLDGNNKKQWFCPKQLVVRTPKKHKNAEKGAYHLNAAQNDIAEDGTAHVYTVINDQTKYRRVIKNQTHVKPGKNRREALQAYLPREAALKEHQYGGHLHAKTVVYKDAEEKISESYVVMDYAGKSLQDVLENDRKGLRKLTDNERLLIGIAVANAYHHQVFAQGIVHQDIKPANIMIDLEKLHHALDDDTISRNFPVKIIDFSTAKKMRDKKVQAPVVPGYIPPEVCEEDEAGEMKMTDTRSDIYNLGIVLAQIFNEHAPENSMIHEPYPLMTIFNDMEDLSGKQRGMIRVLIEIMLEKQPEKRPENLERIINALHTIFSERYGMEKVNDDEVNERDRQISYGSLDDEWEDDLEKEAGTKETPARRPAFFKENKAKILGSAAAGAAVGAFLGAGIGVAISLGAIPFTFGFSVLTLPIVIVPTIGIGAVIGAAIGSLIGLAWAGTHSLKKRPLDLSSHNDNPGQYSHSQLYERSFTLTPEIKRRATTISDFSFCSDKRRSSLISHSIYGNHSAKETSKRSLSMIDNRIKKRMNKSQ